MATRINIKLNGESHQTEAGSVASLVMELGLEKRMIAIELNLEVVPRSQYDDILLAEGDRIELVHMIGGG